MKKQLVIEGMSCGHCSARVKNALETLDTVSNVEVNLADKTATFTVENEISDETFKELIDDVGYEVVKIN